MGSGRAVEVWWAWEGPDAKMEGSSQGHEERDKRLPLTVLQLFPSRNPCSILWLFTPLPTNTAWACRPGALLPPWAHYQVTRGSFLWQPPTPSLPVSISPWSEHRFPTVDLLSWLGLQGEEKIFKAKAVMSAWYNAQALSPRTP